MSLVEATIENCANTWAKKTYEKRILIRKMNGQGYRGWPDRGYWFEGGIHFMIEYKVEGELPEPHQAKVLGELNALGIRSYCADSIEEAKHIIACESTGTPPEADYVKNQWGGWLRVVR